MLVTNVWAKSRWNPILKSGLFVLAILFVISCGETSTQTPGAQPGSPMDPGTNPQDQQPESRAEMQIGSVQRQFSESHLTTCTLDRNRKEAVITFNDEQSGANFSIRMSNLDLSQTSFELQSRGDGTQGSVLISLGGDRRQNTYRYVPAQAGRVGNSGCKINYQMTQTHMAASLVCQNVVNSVGQTAGAAGRWLCKLQAPNEWTW